LVIHTGALKYADASLPGLVIVTGKESTPPLETTSSPRILTSLTGASPASITRGSIGERCA
jgi:hypothetical protein